MRKITNPFWVAVLFASLSASFSFAATFTWTNTAGGNWSVAANWSPNQVPTNTDTAQITTSGTYVVTISSTAAANVLTLGGATGTQTLLLSSGTLSLGSASTGNAQGVFTMSGGILGGAGSLVLAGPINWAGGTITNQVQFNGGTFSNTVSLNGGQAINVGTLNWTGTGLDTGNGSLISNAPAGTINLTANLGEGSFGGAHTFVNAGQFNVAVSGTATISEPFNNSGTVTVNGGTLNLQGGGTETGSFISGSGATNELGSGTFALTNGASFSGAGAFLNNGATANFIGTSSLTTAFVTINSGNVNFNNSSVLNLSVLTMSSGTLQGTNPVTATTFNWSGGTINTNLVQFNGGSFSGGLSLNDGGEIINTGTLSWTAGNINTGNGSLISNAPSGTININVSSMGEGSFGGTRTYNNAGQINVTASTSVNISSVFNNFGSVSVNAGTFETSGGGTSTGSLSAVSGATLEFGGGTYSVSGGSISGAGNFTALGGTVIVGVGLNLSGTWTFGGATTTLNSTTVSGNAVIVSSGTVAFDGTGPWQPGTLQVSGGTLGGTTPVTVLSTGGMNWSAGTITNFVQFTGGTFSGGLSLNNGGEVVNTGTLSWTAANMNTGNGSIISNAPTGTINLTATLSEGSFGGSRTFANAGQLNVTVSGTANISDTFNNTGTVAINTGNLDLSGGGTESASITVASGTTNQFGGGTFALNSGSSISGQGTWLNSGATAIFAGTSTLNTPAVNIQGGSVNFYNSSSLNFPLLNLSAGTLAGVNPVTVSGTFNWTGGSIVTNLVQFNGGTFSNSLTLNSGGEVVNTGTLNWLATTINTGNGSIISNAPTGTINLNALLTEGSFGGSRTFNNAGHLNVSVAGTASINDTFNNTGTIAVNSGSILNLSGGGTETGSFTVASGATNEFGGNTFAVNSGATISGSGTFLNAGGVANFAGTSVLNTPTVIASGTVTFNNSTSLNLPTLTFNAGGLQGTNPVTVTGPFIWTGGSLESNVVKFNGGAFSNTVVLNNGGEIINTGTLNWSATTIDDGNGSIVSNAPTGTINLTTALSEGVLGGVRSFNNGGQLNVAVSGTANIGANFTNTGTITFNSGILNLSGTHNLTGGTLNFGINALNNYGSNSLASAANLAGTLKSVFNGSYLPSVGNTYNIMTYGSSSGNFTVTNLSPVAVWQVNQNAAALSITVLKLVPQVAWATPFDMFYGNSLGGLQLDASATWNGTNVPGVLNYTPGSGTVLNSGSNQVLSVTFVPNDPSTFISVTTNVLVNVQKSPLVITATNITKTYGQTITFTGTEFFTGGLVNGDFVTSATLSSIGAPPTAAVSGIAPYIINITNAVGDAGLTNYNIFYNDGQLTVNNANLVITANNTNKIVGETLTFAGTEFTVSGLQNGETIGTVTLTSAGAAAGAGAGSYPIVAGTPINGGTFIQFNYFDTFNNGTLTVVGVPSLAIAFNGTQDILTFPAILGQSYQVLSTTNLTTAMTPLGPAISHTNGIVNVTNNINGQQTFYRLQMQLGP